MPASWSSRTACHCNLCLYTVSLSDGGSAYHGRIQDSPFVLLFDLLPGRLQLHRRAEGEWNQSKGPEREHAKLVYVWGGGCQSSWYLSDVHEGPG